MSDALAQAAQLAAGVQVVAANVVSDPDSDGSGSDENGEVEEVVAEAGPKQGKKRKARQTEEIRTAEQNADPEIPQTKRQRKKQNRKTKREAKKQKNEALVVDS